MAVNFDPRTKLYLLILAMVILSLNVNVTTEIILTILYILPFFLSKEYKWGLAFVMIYSVQLSTAYFILPQVTSSFFLYILTLLVSGFRRMMTSIIAGTYAIKTTHVGEWISVLKKWKMPDFVTVPFAVIARFFPTILEDYRHIRRAMAFRGIGDNPISIIRHPIHSFEYILIPLLMNASYVAQDLTISALTKGLSMPGKHTSIVNLKITLLDWVYIIIVFIPLLLYLGGQL